MRTDWTRVARDFQEELYRRIFLREPFEDYVKQVTASVLAGEQDEQLVYRKRLRRKLDDYQRNVPPHVQAARLCAERGLPVPSRGDWVEYVITTSGAEPAARPLARWTTSTTWTGSWRRWPTVSWVLLAPHSAR